ncbi:uncharacterized protein CTRU02_215747 [Colletotrichum truncatum]|uniref:Uncharacterized protein n=1 Tax=Colletotrichum truncatum TaxID=5467 RepID=A0ACC3YBT2_COLTU|nr:uncharacterized protein CTRU02_15209 [Colletotrichum truncatum]KAF6781319.1 hypothetical protein CTRU02_15209 [Colletotrichum truncatum]
MASHCPLRSHAEPCEHPSDGFSMVRISLKLPSRSDRRRADQDEDAEDSEDDGASLQSLELCFHDDFTPEDSLPVSLHFQSTVITCFKSSLVYPTPTPPCYVHELRAIMDLTTPMEEDDDAAVSVSDPGSSVMEAARPSLFERLGSFSDSIRIFLMVLSFLGLVAALILWAFASPAQMFIFRHNVSTTNNTLALFHQVLRIDRLRISSVQDLLAYAAVDRNPDFDEAFDIVESLCHNTIRITRRPQLHRDEEVEMVCASLFWHASTMKAHWRSVSREMLQDWPTKTLRALRRTFEGIDAGLETRWVAHIYRLLEDSDWVRSCKLCDWDQYGVRSWHFACEDGFRALLPSHVTDVSEDVVDRTRAYLDEWADRQSRRRAETMRDPQWHLRGRLDRHPIESCAEITNHTLGVEDDVVSVARHMFEMRADLRRLAVVLRKHGLAPGLKRFYPDGWTSSAYFTAIPTTSQNPLRPSPTDQHQPILQRVGNMIRAGIEHLGEPHGARDAHMTDVVERNAVMLFEIFRGLEGFEHALARAALGLVKACELGSELWKYLRSLSKGLEPVSWDVNVEDVAFPLAPGKPYTITLQVSYTKYTADAVEEAAKLAAGIADLHSAFPPRPTRTPVIFEGDGDGDVDLEQQMRQHPWLMDLMDFSYAASAMARGENKTMETQEGTLLVPTATNDAGA